MTEQASSSLGIQILRDGLALGEVYDHTFPELTADKTDTSAQNNIGGVETKTVAWIRTGDQSFKLRMIGDTAQTALETAFYNRTSSIWTVILPMGSDLSAHCFTWVGQIAKFAPILDGTETAAFDLAVTVNGVVSHVSTRAAGLTSPFFVTADSAESLTPSPTASASIYEYTVSAFSNSTTVTVTPTATAGTIYVNGTPVTTGDASGAINLNTGTGAITMVPIVVTDVNKTPRVYWLRYVIGTTARP